MAEQKSKFQAIFKQFLLEQLKISADSLKLFLGVKWTFGSINIVLKYFLELKKIYQYTVMIFGVNQFAES
jgi:hypothetical protein